MCLSCSVLAQEYLYGIGTVVLQAPSKDSSALHTVCIKGAYYVPDQPLNILSVHDVLSLHGAVVFESTPGTPSHIRWPNNTGDTYQAMLWCRNLLYIECCSGAVQVDTIRRALPPGLGYDGVHATFGHMEQAKLKQLVSEAYVDASKICAGKHCSCLACEEANAKLESYHSQQDLTARMLIVYCIQICCNCRWLRLMESNTCCLLQMNTVAVSKEI
jgi:hypothetical protein